MKVKQTIISFAGLVAVTVGLLAAPAPVYAQSSCGGVETSVISCKQPGSCSGGEDPYEGRDPGDNASEKTAYKAQYGHDFGLCKDGSKPNDAVTSSGIWGVLLMILNIMTAGVGVLAVLGVVWGSVLYASAGDRAEQTKKAKEIITNVVIGIVAFGLMYAFLNFLIPGGIFT